MDPIGWAGKDVQRAPMNEPLHEGTHGPRLDEEPPPPTQHPPGHQSESGTVAVQWQCSGSGTPSCLLQGQNYSSGFAVKDVERTVVEVKVVRAFVEHYIGFSLSVAVAWSREIKIIGFTREPRSNGSGRRKRTGDRGLWGDGLWSLQ